MIRITQSITLLGCLAVATVAIAQPPRDRGGDDDHQGPNERQSPIERIMSLDKNNDGVVEEAELVETRLQRIFDRADSNQDGKLTRAELTAAMESRADSDRAGDAQPEDRPRRGERRDVERRDVQQGDGEPRRPDRFGRRGPGGFGPAGFGPAGPPKPGTILPAFIQQSLELTDQQKSQLAQLQQHVDAELKEILTPEQQQQLQSGRGLRPPFRGPRDGGPPPGGPREGGRPPRFRE